MDDERRVTGASVAGRHISRSAALLLQPFGLGPVALAAKRIGTACDGLTSGPCCYPISALRAHLSNSVLNRKNNPMQSRYRVFKTLWKSHADPVELTANHFGMKTSRNCHFRRKREREQFVR